MLTCYLGACAIQFAAPAEWFDYRRRDHASFYCPNGHAQAFLTKSREELLKEELKRERQSVEYYRKRNMTLEERQTTLKRRVAAQKGVATRLRNKAIAGECAFCHQRFPDVVAHVEAEHPGEVAEEEEAPDAD